MNDKPWLARCREVTNFRRLNPCTWPPASGCGTWPSSWGLSKGQVEGEGSPQFCFLLGVVESEAGVRDLRLQAVVVLIVLVRAPFFAVFVFARAQVLRVLACSGVGDRCGGGCGAACAAPCAPLPVLPAALLPPTALRLFLLLLVLLLPSVLPVPSVVVRRPGVVGGWGCASARTRTCAVWAATAGAVGLDDTQKDHAM